MKYRKLQEWFGTNWGIALLLALVTLMVLSPVLFIHNTTFFTNLDNVDQFYTWYQKLAVAWHHGYLPLWNANVYGGWPFAGEIQPGLLYPLNWLWVAIFGSGTGISEMALNYLMAVHFWLAAFGCYLLVKEMGARRWAAFLAGVGFAFSGVVAFRSISQSVIFFGLAWLPYSLFFLIKFHRDPRRRWLIASGVTLGLLLVVGHIQPFFHALLALGVIELVYLINQYKDRSQLWPQLRRAILSFVIIGVSAFVIALPQLWLSAPYLPHAYRVQAVGYAGPGEKIGYGEFSKAFNLDIHEFANLIDPVSYPIRDGNSIFIGLAPLGVILLVAFLAREKLRRTALWRAHGRLVTWLLVLSFLAMLGYTTWFAVVLYKLPFVYQIRQLGRYSILFDLGLAMVLAAALEVYALLNLKRHQVRNLTLIGLFLVINSVYLYLLRHHIFSLHYALQVGLLGLGILTIAFLQRPQLRRVCLTLILLVTASVNTLWFLPNIRSDTEVPAHYHLSNEVLSVLEQTTGQYRVEIDNNALPLNLGNVYNVQTVGGYSATMYAPFYEFVHKSNLNPEFMSDILGVQLVADKQPRPSLEQVYAVPADQLYIMKRASALPKLFTTTKPGSVDRQDYQPLSVTTMHYDDLDQRYTVQVPMDNDVIISELYYQGWQARIDGRAVPIKDYAIAGHPLLNEVHVPKGTHNVELTFKAFGLF